MIILVFAAQHDKYYIGIIEADLICVGGVLLGERVIGILQGLLLRFCSFQLSVGIFQLLSKVRHRIREGLKLFFCGFQLLLCGGFVVFCLTDAGFHITNLTV